MSTNLKTDEKVVYSRHAAKHRHHIKKGAQFAPEADRYHLHIALACPWADGVLAMLYLKGLDHIISHSIVHPTWAKTSPDPADEHFGWVYKKPGDEPLSNSLGHGSFKCDESLIPDEFTNVASVRELYNQVGDNSGPYTTPTLYDKKTKQIVSNESTEILKMLNFEFEDFAKNNINFYPEELMEKLQELNDTLVYPKVNNGVYRCGFAKSQDAYDTAVEELFAALEELELRLSKQRYLGGSTFTWLDLRLFMTMVRFDPVYITYFKTNKKRLVDYPNILGFVRDVYSMQPVNKAINIDHIKTHYFTSHPHLNTFGIIPAYDGPDLDLPHGRENM
jgi:putative glutathione S-transferase